MIPARASLTIALAIAAVLSLLDPAPAVAAEGQLTIAVHNRLAPTWFDPAETAGETLLQRIQQLMHERAMFAPIVEPALLTGVGPRVGEGPTIPGHPYFSPYEDLRLKAR